MLFMSELVCHFVPDNDYCSNKDVIYNDNDKADDNYNFTNKSNIYGSIF